MVLSRLLIICLSLFFALNSYASNTLNCLDAQVRGKGIVEGLYWMEVTNRCDKYIQFLPQLTRANGKHEPLYDKKPRDLPLMDFNVVGKNANDVLKEFYSPADSIHCIYPKQYAFFSFVLKPNESIKAIRFPLAPQTECDEK